MKQGYRDADGGRSQGKTFINCHQLGPFPNLPKRFVFVDTPGFGHNSVEDPEYAFLFSLITRLVLLPSH